MYRPLAGQLRILFCDSNRRQDNSLLVRAFPNFSLSPLRSPCTRDLSTFDKMYVDRGRRNILDDQGQRNHVIDLMPFEIQRFQGGLEAGRLVLDPNADPIWLQDWLQQVVTIHPVRVTVRTLIRTIADRGGGAHVDEAVDKLIERLATSHPCNTGLHALLTVGLGRLAQQIGWQIVQFHEQFGVAGSLSDPDFQFDYQHHSVRSAARIPEKLIRTRHEIIELGIVRQ